MARPFRLLLLILAISGVLVLTFRMPIIQPVMAQQPTGSVPTVTGTPAGVIVVVYLDLAQISVYAGPSTYLYPAIGVLLAGQEVPAYGVSEDGNWIQIYYPGVPESIAWVYAPYVSIKKAGELPEIAAPPTPTPASTPTIDPTLAAAFIGAQTPTRLSTFTPPAPLVIATYADEPTSPGRMPMGLLIFGCGFIGSLGALISFLRGR
jgi:uncharacterized protein YraI